MKFYLQVDKTYLSMSDLTDKLGFYFIVFQKARPNSKFLKCWIDGDDKVIFYKEEELLDFCNRCGYDSVMEGKLKEAFNLSCIFLWDIEARSLRKLSPAAELQSSGPDVFQALKPSKVCNNNFIINNNFVNYSDGKISFS